MASPKSQPTALKDLKGTLRKHRTLEDELKFENMTHIPEPPDAFNETTIQLWLGCCMSLQGVGLLFAQDLPQLEQYCYAVFMMRKSREMTMSGDIVFEQTNKAGHIYQVIDKWIKINLDYTVIVNKLGGEFGFSPSSRTKISTGQPSTTDILDDL